MINIEVAMLDIAGVGVEGMGADGSRSTLIDHVMFQNERDKQEETDGKN